MDFFAYRLLESAIVVVIEKIFGSAAFFFMYFF